MKRTSDMRGDHLGADVVFEKASDVLAVLVPLLEPEVELGGGYRIKANELQGEVGGYGRGGGQGQESGNVGSNLEGNPGPEGDLHDGGGAGRKRVGWSGAESRRESLDGRNRCVIRRLDGDGGNIRDGGEVGRAESGGRRGGHAGGTSSSGSMSRRWRKETGGSNSELDIVENRAAPAIRASGLPTSFSDGAKSGDINVTILIDGHLRELISERDRCGERLGERRAGQEDLPNNPEERHLVHLGETGEEECQPGAGRGRDELDGDEGVRGKRYD